MTVITEKAGILTAKILENHEISDGIYRMVLYYGPETAGVEPGQFVNLYLGDKSMLLPRPISICLAEDEKITLVYRVVGKGTEVLSRCQAGTDIAVSTPLGHGYDLEAVFNALNETNGETRTIAFVAGGLGIPPMVQLARTIKIRSSMSATSKESKVRLISLLGFQKESFLTDALTCCDDIFVATESGDEGYHGNVLEMMKIKNIKADYYLSCGPKPMLKALAAYCADADKPLQVSLEERMGCGYGACVGCTCKTRSMEDDTMKYKLKKVCKDGPVFFGHEVAWDD
jgi:2-polyprenylphenol hydroxylase and related flavodoxin oxidoreductases